MQPFGLTLPTAAPYLAVIEAAHLVRVEIRACAVINPSSWPNSPNVRKIPLDSDFAGWGTNRDRI
jgi:hypothetical protein